MEPVSFDSLGVTFFGGVFMTWVEFCHWDDRRCQLELEKSYEDGGFSR